MGWGGRRRRGVLAAGGGIAAALALLAGARRRFEKRADGLVRRVVAQASRPPQAQTGATSTAQATAADRPHTVIGEEMLAGLPEPAQRYLRRAGVVGRPLQRGIRLEQEGRFRSSPQRSPMAVRAVQYFSADPVGFVWDATFRIAGLPLVRALDSHLDGQGHMLGRALFVWPIMDVRGPKLTQGTLMRHAAEMVWFPSALLGRNVAWRSRDAHSAEMTLSDESEHACVTFHIDADGDVILLEGQRWGDFDGCFELRTWKVTMAEYATFQGLRVPCSGQVVWELPDGDFPYFDWRITGIEPIVAGPRRSPA